MSSPTRARLAELAEQWSLPAGAAERLRGLLTLVEEEHSSITAVRDPLRAADVHVADSLAGLAVPAIGTARALVDLGSGGGFPGLALAIALPGTAVTVLDSVGKKVAFLRHAATELGLENVTAVQARAEAWPEGLGAHDVVTARAVAPLNVLAEYAAPLLALHGTLVAWKGHRDAVAEGDAATAADLLGLEPGPVLAAAGARGVEARNLHLYSKVRPTPDRYPRREGIARKRPLGASGRG